MAEQPFLTHLLGTAQDPDWQALRPYPDFLFRSVGDQDRALLFVGCADQAEWPRVCPDGRVADWWYGFVSYDLKDRLERLHSRHADPMGHPTSRWHMPRWVVEWRAGTMWLHVRSQDLEEAHRCCDRLFARPSEHPLSALTFRLGTPRERYLHQAGRLLDHIQRGDIYEINYCIQRTAHAPALDPYAVFARMWALRPRFAAFHRWNDRFAMSASPERFLAFTGDLVMGQPMKGTRPRDPDPHRDRALAGELANDPKERSENIMALDVMRNDLSRVAAPATVQVEALCAVESHPQVHQMISTVTARLAPHCSPIDAILAAFPMASMTGAPKVRAMQLIDAMEDQARGLYSGTLGFFAPDGTGDLNVVIRTLLYHAGTGLVSLSTGSALTALADPAQEWEECEVKARSVMALVAP